MKDKTLWICNQPWTVKFVGSEIYYEGKKVYGLCDKHRHVLHIGTLDRDECGVASALYHETGHAILETVTNGHPEDEEECVQSREVGGFSIMRDRRNAWWVEMVRG